MEFVISNEIILVFSILAAVIVLLVTEWIELEVIALLVLGAIALTGIISPIEALSGFSNPAVVTIWAVFILSGGLTRTGIANILGRYLLKVAGFKLPYLVAMIMSLAGVLSAFMNNIAVAALMLPVVMDLARKTKHSPSILLMPLAFGSLLGGLTTMIGTPPNILATEAMRQNNLTPFGMFDFAPIGLIIMFSGIAFVSFVGIKMLPRKSRALDSNLLNNDFLSQYELDKQLALIRIPAKSPFVNKTLTKSRLGSGFGLNVVGINRGDTAILAPDSTEVIKAEDKLIVCGSPKQAIEINYCEQMELESDKQSIEELLNCEMQLAEISPSTISEYIGQRLSNIDFRNKFGLNVLAIKHAKGFTTEDLRNKKIKRDDTLLIQGSIAHVREFQNNKNFLVLNASNPVYLLNKYPLASRAHVLKVPELSKLIGLSLGECRLGEAIDVQVLCIRRKDDSYVIPNCKDRFESEDVLVVLGSMDMISLMLEHDPDSFFTEDQSFVIDPADLENDHVGIVEVMLSPHSVLAGLTLRQHNFRKKYGLAVLAILRKGKAYRSNLRDMSIEFGDVILLHGNWKGLLVLGQEPDFLVLTETAQEVPRKEKAKFAVGIMAAVLFPVILGWIPIYIAVVIGAALMVLTKCLTMEEAYRYIEWKAVFLIAGMLPLGIALERSGAAGLIAESVLNIMGPFGPHAVLFSLLLITLIATSIIPTAALVVLMVPITLKTATVFGISPHALMMGVALAASSSFTSPISHPANVLVMGPGGYRFKDYIKLGFPLTLIVLVVLMVFLPIFWPLKP
ncbi:MAG: SLC13 family permease [Calditrichaeota bacterium]|nr:SLC13 family permease [Calditrichota bacterium]MBT7618787.1 SLC13 family permease [Calditrichota bacterium]MBT7789394.1 SLC13 family permease [Calditrichota bacterium]